MKTSLEDYPGSKGKLDSNASKAYAQGFNSRTLSWSEEFYLDQRAYLHIFSICLFLLVKELVPISQGLRNQHTLHQLLIYVYILIVMVFSFTQRTFSQIILLQTTDLFFFFPSFFFLFFFFPLFLVLEGGFIILKSLSKETFTLSFGELSACLWILTPYQLATSKQNTGAEAS